MKERIRDIKIKIVCDGHTYEFDIYEGEYRSLMMLIYDKIYIDGFGACKGMGRCGTCLVEIKDCPLLTIMDRNEFATISKLNIRNNNVRLACQVLIDKLLDNISVYILDEKYI